MDNCFTYTFKKLQDAGYDLPKRWGNYTQDDMRLFIVDYKFFLDNKLHYKFFNSFCERVDQATKNDIILDDNSVGIAINSFKYMSINDRNMKEKLFDINKNKIIMRIK
jgi:hypothetical protein